jgi:DNA-binding response OmpR family regulator
LELAAISIAVRICRFRPRLQTAIKPPGPDPVHALIVNHESFCSPIRETLEGIGYTSFDLASSAAAARACARRRSPDLIVTAYRLPDGTAKDVIAAICAARAFPVVFVTIETDAVLNWLPSAVIVTSPFDQMPLEIAVEEAMLKPTANRHRSNRPIGGSTALLYS